MFNFFRRKKETPKPTYSEIIEEYRETSDKIKKEFDDWVRLMPLQNHDLDPCPFCGGVAHEVTEVLKGNCALRSFVECSHCCSRTRDMTVGPHADPYSELKDSWNQRTSSTVANVAINSTAQPIFRMTAAEADDPKMQCAYCLMPKAHMNHCMQLNHGFCQRFQDSARGQSQ